MRTLVIGDIHGGLRALVQVLEKVLITPKDQFIFVGDYVDGWSDSSETISYLIDFAKNNDCVFLRGNHDELLYTYLKYNEDNPMWLQHGGMSSKKSYSKLSSVEKSIHMQFLEGLKNYYIDEGNRLFVHAGFTNMHGPQYEHYPNMVYWDRTLWEVAQSLDPSLGKEELHYPKRLKLFSEIFIGHTPVTHLGATRPLHFANVWNVDTGAGFKGPLSILDVQTKKVWQSDPVWQLYPDELGRN